VRGNRLKQLSRGIEQVAAHRARAPSTRTGQLEQNRALVVRVSAAY
jgi:hypothetical protein